MKFQVVDILIISGLLVATFLVAFIEHIAPRRQDFKQEKPRSARDKNSPSENENFNSLMDKELQKWD